MNPTEPTHVGDELAINLGEGLAALSEHGLLWALNQYLLHGEGVEIRVQGDRVLLVGDGRTVKSWAAEHAEGVVERRTAYKQTLQDARTFNAAGYWKGHSAGFGQGRPVDMVARARSGRG